MIKFTTLSKKLKRDVEYIDNVTFGNYEGSECICLIQFKSLPDVPFPSSSKLVRIINTYFNECDAQLNWQTCSSHIDIMFKVKLS